MPTPSRQLLSRTIYDTDGVTVNWDFSFSGGYLDREHVKAYVDLPTGERTELTVTAGMFTGPYQLAITPAILSGRTLTIYRDTPKGLPLVDFTDGAGFSEVSLDIMAKQSVFVSAESVDTLNTSSNYEAAVSAEAAQISQLAAAASAASAAVSANSAAISAASINPASFATAAQGARADTAIQPAGFTVTAINGATSLGRNLMAAVDAAAARVLLGLSTFGSSIVQAADAAVARLLLGAAAAGVNSDITNLTALTAGGLPDNSVLASDIAPLAVTATKLSGGQTGDAPVYGARAWVHFDAGRNSSGGTDTANTARFLRASGNVNSVLKLASGHYRVSLIVPMSNAEYAVFGCGSPSYGLRPGSIVAVNSTPAWGEVAPTPSTFEVAFSDDQGATINPKYGSLFVFA